MRKEIAKGYFLTNDGRVYSDRRQGSKGHYVAMAVGTWGYLMFKIWKDGKCINKQLHRELAKAFIPNPDNLRCVNHKDGCKLNNKLENLEWCTSSYNNKHAYDNGLRKKVSASGHRYIYHQKGTSRIRVKIAYGYKKIINAGYYDTLEEAIKARDRIIKTLHEEIRTN